MIPKTHPTWLFDSSPIPDPLGYGARAVRFLKALRHPESTAAGNAFQVDPWLERLVLAIYGPRHPDGTRIVKRVPMLLPRGNRKTTLCAALALLHTLGPERKPFSEVIAAAADRKQAALVHKQAVDIIRMDKRLVNVSKLLDYRHKIISKKHGTFFEAISSDGKTQHGRSPSLIICDELHSWETLKLWNALESAIVKKDPLVILASTAGAGREHIAWVQYEQARRIARGEEVNPTVLPVLFEASADEDWRDERVWFRVNPGLSCNPPYQSLSAMRDQAKQAESVPSTKANFLQYNLNVWADNSVSPFVDMGVYDGGADQIDFDRLKSEPCWLGIDLSQVYDMTCIVACWKDGKGGYIVRPWFFLPKEQLAKRETAGYREWVDRKFIEESPGAAIDYEFFHRRLVEICGELNVQQIGVDPKGANPTLNALMNKGLPVFQFSQANGSMCPAVHELERAIVAGQFGHGGNPVLRWCFENVRTVDTADGYKRFHKGKSEHKIDGAVAAAMAVKLAFDSDNPGRAIDDPNFDFSKFMNT
ncbi:terminase large subunit [Xanthobacter autotrophicus]|uniref:terminase large subunit n=1 Tax=Xanthobacter autotrophicus TaxID=280 RepID=UPI003726F87B